MSSIVTSPTAEQIAKLPVWAQRHIAWLQQSRADDARQIAGLSAGPENSDTYLNEYETYPDRLLGRGTTVSFRVSASDGHDSGVITARASEDYLEIRTPDGSLHITPRSSNVVKARIGKY